MELSSTTSLIGTSIASMKTNNNTCPAKEHQQQEQKQQDIDCLASSIASPKPNQVSTVLLYGIPIVSLYIESQERLCLAQISNTLLKQFSYNEIHNRRVALGITCVQCTPVQLEILRRAGAMPVSSRRCGMITRREAERLCKSFLGDNAPPRLPDDFAFSVHHKCAWGCRGSFLPSRYNSSRAKCIKCSYCGLFFSPNKFIFHSHRIGPGDKYVQPDAANFNSWRRHMKLSGTPPEEITHAWEDVKAMFNGGTRKRLMTTASSSITAVAVAVTAIATNSTSSSSSSSSSKAAQSPKRFKESSPGRANSVNTPPGQIPLRPLNIHQQHGSSGGCFNSLPSSNQISNLPGRSSSTDITLPFSRNFMMDYMWHAHAQNKASNSHFHFPNYSLPWIKGSASSFIFGSGNQNASMTTISATQQDQNLTSSSNNLDNVNPSDASPSGSNERFGSPPHSYSSTTAAHEVDTLTGFYNSSAFKPVMQLNRSASTYSSTSSKTLALETVAAVAAAAAVTVTSNDNEHKALNQITAVTENHQHASSTPQIKESFSSDDEMVDIETTEEEEKPFEHEQKGMKLLKMDDYNEALRKPIIVDNSKDAWKKFMEKEHPLQSHTTCRMQSPTSSLISHSPASSINSEHHVSYQQSNKSTSSTPDVVLATSPAPSSGSMSLDFPKNTIPEQQRNVAAAIVSAFSHHRHHHQNQFHPFQQQNSHLPCLPLPLSTAAIASVTNGSAPISPASLVTGRFKADFNSNGNTIFGTRPHSFNSIEKNNQTFLVNTNNNNLTSANSSGEAIVQPCVNNEFWSVARLSVNRPNDYNPQQRVPITTEFHRHHHDITKHFQAFRHHGHETTTQTNGVG